MIITKRHHYLPQFFLKGFVGSDAQLAVYDTVKQEIKRQRYAPKRIFFEFDRNTVEIDGEPDDYIEKRYGYIESQIAPTFQKLHSEKTKVDIDYRDLQDIIMFVGYTYWRIPETDDLIKEFINKSNPKDLRFTIRNKHDNSEAPEDLYIAVSKKPAFVLSYRIIKPIIDYLTYNIEDQKDWQIYYPQNGREIHLISDNPIIFRDSSQENIFDREFIMPLTSGKTLYHIKKKKVIIITPEDTMKIDVLVFLQAKKYVCGPDAGWLNAVSFIASQYKTSEDISRLKEEVFSIFE